MSSRATPAAPNPGRRSISSVVGVLVEEHAWREDERPCERPLAKNQILSRLIGPPNPGLKSQFLSTVPGVDERRVAREQRR